MQKAGNKKDSREKVGSWKYKDGSEDIVKWELEGWNNGMLENCKGPSTPSLSAKAD